jgi:hypothetical protein
MWIPARAVAQPDGNAPPQQSTPKSAIDNVKKKHDGHHPTVPPLSRGERLEFIRRAQVWTPTDVSAVDVRSGPDGGGAFEPDAMVVCDYFKTKLPGHTQKFDCAVTPDDIVKVRYGATNGEVQGSILGSRLLWALGFGADRVYSVIVTCRGCTADPFVDTAKVGGERVFKPAAIERKPEGHEMKGSSPAQSGWKWDELALVDESQGGATKAQVDALRLLAVFMQHTDSKAEQQRLLCLPGGLLDDGTCSRPFLMVHDIGLTFGRATKRNNNEPSSVNFAEWSKTPVWRDAKKCVAGLEKSFTGTLENPVISEAGRAFLADLLSQLSHEQIHDLFDAAHVDQRNLKPDSYKGAASIAEWVDAFKHKRDEILNAHCPK